MAYVEDRYKVKVTKTGKPGRTTGKRWRVRYKDAGGKWRAKSFDKKSVADTFCAGTKTDVDRGTWVDPDLGKETLAVYAKRWLKSRPVEASTRERMEERFRLHILPVFGDQPLAQLANQPTVIQGWVQGLPLAASYKKAVFTHLSACLQSALEDGRISRNPCRLKSVKPEKQDRPKIIPWEQGNVDRVRELLPARYRAMTDAGAGLGMRQGEVLGLAPEDIEWIRGVVHIRRQVRIVGSRLCFAPPKGGKERTVPLPESVHLRLSAHLAAFPAAEVTLPRKEPGGKPETHRLMFTTTRQRAISRTYFDQYVWRPAVAKASIAADGKAVLPPERETGFHQLRHYFASALLAGTDDVLGEDIRTLAEYLGHSDPGFTLRNYAHFQPGREHRMGKIVDALSRTSKGPEKAQPGFGS